MNSLIQISKIKENVVNKQYWNDPQGTTREEERGKGRTPGLMTMLQVLIFITMMVTPASATGGGDKTITQAILSSSQ